MSKFLVNNHHMINHTDMKKKSGKRRFIKWEKGKLKRGGNGRKMVTFDTTPIVSVLVRRERENL